MLAVMEKCCHMHKVCIQISEFNNPEILKITLELGSPQYILMAAHLVLSLLAFYVCCVKVLTWPHTVTCQARAHGNSAMSYRHLHVKARQE